MDFLFTNGEISFQNSLFRLLISFIAGALIGMNREKQNQAAGFRTHILICTGSCLLMLVSIYIPQEFLNFKNGDPGRIAAQVITGIGFLGAGAIIRLGDHVKGLTTAASIWVSAAIGLAFGSGMLWIGLVTLALVMITLGLLERIEKIFFKKKMAKIIEFQLKQPNADISEIYAIFNHFHLKYEVSEYHQISYQGIFRVEMIIIIPENFQIEKLFQEFSKVPNIQEMAIRNRS
jgi:putative Mg2+ transporter-C (MgtC) family protein